MIPVEGAERLGTSSGERGGKQGTHSVGLLFGPHSEVRYRQSPEWAGQLPDQASLLPSPFAPPPPGLENWVWAEDMAFVPTAVPWSPEHQIQSLQVTRKQLETEEQAAFPLGESSPRYLYLASKQNNKWGHPRGYRIQTVSFAGGPLPQNSSMGRAFSWGRWVGCVVGGGWM